MRLVERVGARWKKNIVFAREKKKTTKNNIRHIGWGTRVTE